VAFDRDLAGGEGNRLVGLKLHFQAWCGGTWSINFVSVEDTVFDDTSTCQSNHSMIERCIRCRLAWPRGRASMSAGRTPSS